MTAELLPDKGQFSCLYSNTSWYKNTESGLDKYFANPTFSSLVIYGLAPQLIMCFYWTIHPFKLTLGWVMVFQM